MINIKNKGESVIRKILKLMMFFASIPLVVNAQETKQLNLDQAIQIGLENNYSIKISKSKVNAADYKIKESEANMYPSLKFAGAYTRLSAIDPVKIMGYVVAPSINDNYNLKLTAAQPIFSGNRLTETNEISKLNKSASEEDLKRDKEDLILSIKNAYWNLYQAGENLNSIEESIEQTKAHLKDLENQKDQGMATDNDVLKVQVQVSNNELMKIDAENTIQIAMTNLNSILCLPLSTMIEIPKNLDFNNEDVADLNTYLNSAQSERNELKSMGLKKKAAEASVKVAKSGLYPQINLAANYYYANPNSRIFPQEQKFTGTWDIGISLSYDIWNWSITKHQMAQAQESLEQANYTINQLKDQISLEVTQAYLNLVKSKEKIKVSDLTVNQAKENYRVTNEKFLAGLALNSDLLDAETALLQAKINYTSSVAQYEMALAKLNRSINK